MSEHIKNTRSAIEAKRDLLGASCPHYFEYLKRNVRRLERNVKAYNDILSDLETVDESQWTAADRAKYDFNYRLYILDSEALETYKGYLK